MEKLCLIVLLILAGCNFLPRKVTISSPDGHLETELFVRAGKLYYAVYKDGQEIFTPSSLGLKIGGTNLGRSARIGQPQYNQEAGTFFYHENQDTILYRFNEVFVPILHRRSGSRFLLEWRVYNEGLAFRYSLAEGFVENSVFFKEELTEWNIGTENDKEAEVWIERADEDGQRVFKSTSLTSLSKDSLIRLPITIKLPDTAGYAAIFEHEVPQVNPIALLPISSKGLKAEYVGNREGWKSAYQKNSSWRAMIITPRLDGLVNNQMAKHLRYLNDRRDGKIRYAEPGRMLRYTYKKDTSGLARFSAFIDQASQTGADFVLLENPILTRTDTVHLREIVSIAKWNDIGIWLRMREASVTDERFRRDMFAFCQQIGITGIELTYLSNDVGITRGIKLAKMAEEANAFGLMMNVYLSSQDAASLYALPDISSYIKDFPTYSSEQPISSSRQLLAHMTILPFTQASRELISFPTARMRIPKNSIFGSVHHLARMIVFNSPIDYWVDPPPQYLFHSGFDVIKDIPPTWDEIRVLPISKIGEIVAIAKRRQDKWYVGVLNGADSRNISIPLSFLPEGNHQMVVLSDPSSFNGNVLRSESVISPDKSIDFELASGSGLLMQFRPSNLDNQSIQIKYASTHLANPVQVNMNVPEGSYQIRYTTDGSEVSARSALYRKPIIIRKPSTLKARAFKGKTSQLAKSEVSFFSFLGPTIFSGDTLFWKETYVELGSEREVPIRYSLNGKNPGWRSPIYKGPIRLTRSVTLSASYFLPIGVQSEATVKTFRRSVPAESVELGRISQGLRYAYLPNHFTEPTSLFSDAAARDGIVKSLRPRLKWMKDSAYTMTFGGYIKISEDNLYTFSVISDGEVFIKIAQKDIIHHLPSGIDLETKGAIGLKKGWHPILIAYRGILGENDIQLSYASLATGKAEISKNLYVYEP